MEVERKKRGIWNKFSVMLLVFMILSLTFLGVHIWKVYSNALMKNQIEQLRLESRTLAKYMSVTLVGYEDSVQYLAEQQEMGNLTDAQVSNYVNNQTEFVEDVFWLDEDGNIEKSIFHTKAEKPMFLSQVDDACSIWMYEGEDETRYMTFRYKLLSGKSISLIVDATQYYEKLIADIEIGTNGYVVIKNSDRIMIMHPDPKQWGIDTIKGREEMYPDLDYTSLENMIDQQLRGSEGVAEYYSYWWMDPKLPRVKKLSAYAPVDIGDDFWIVSAVIDYSDFYEPIKSGIGKLAVIFLAALIIFVLLFLLIVKLASDRRKAAGEIDKLKELNGVLEEIRKEEEKLAYKQRLQIIGSMTGGIAHEFTSFLTPVKQQADFLMERLEKDTKEYKAAKDIYDSVEKEEGFVNQIDQMSLKNTETAYQCIPAAKLIKEFIYMAETVQHDQIRFESWIELGNQCIFGNSTQLKQVFLNIFANAVQAIHRQDGLIRFHASCVSRPQAEKNTGRNLPGTWESYVWIAIEDNGDGMEREAQNHIFEPFFTTKGEDGTGLGLVMAEQIVIAHEGIIYAESEEGKGSVFNILLPVSERQDG